MNKNKRNSKKVLAAICAFSGAFGGNSGAASAALKNKKTTTVKTDVKSKNLSLNRQSGNRNFFGKTWDLIKANPITSGLITAGGLAVVVGAPVAVAKLSKGKKNDDNPEKKLFKVMKDDKKAKQNDDKDKIQENQEENEENKRQNQEENKTQNQEENKRQNQEENKTQNQEENKTQNQKENNGENDKTEEKEYRIEVITEDRQPKAAMILNNSNGNGLTKITVQQELSSVSSKVKPCFDKLDNNDFAIFKVKEEKPSVGQDKVYYTVIFSNEAKLKNNFEKHLKKISNTNFSNVLIVHGLASTFHDEDWSMSDGYDLSFNENSGKFNLATK